MEKFQNSKESTKKYQNNQSKFDILFLEIPMGKDSGLVG